MQQTRQGLYLIFFIHACAKAIYCVSQRCCPFIFIGSSYKNVQDLLKMQRNMVKNKSFEEFYNFIVLRELRIFFTDRVKNYARITIGLYYYHSPLPLYPPLLESTDRAWPARKEGSGVSCPAADRDQSCLYPTISINLSTRTYWVPQKLPQIYTVICVYLYWEVGVICSIYLS